MKIKAKDEQIPLIKYFINLEKNSTNGNRD
jgi:hypothetical protein